MGLKLHLNCTNKEYIRVYDNTIPIAKKLQFLYHMCGRGRVYTICNIIWLPWGRSIILWTVSVSRISVKLSHSMSEPSPSGLFTATLKRYTDLLKRHTEVLKRHTEVLKRHTEVLKPYTEVLKPYTEVLKRYTEVLSYFLLLTFLSMATRWLSIGSDCVSRNSFWICFRLIRVVSSPEQDDSRIHKNTSRDRETCTEAWTCYSTIKAMNGNRELSVSMFGTTVIL